MTIERLERAWEMLIDVTEGQLMPFGNGQYEEITKVYGEQIRDVKNLITAEIERQVLIVAGLKSLMGEE